jgi:tetratricopeptide (TPR) repeat protein
MMERVLVTLSGDGSAGIKAAVRIGDQEHAAESYSSLPRELVEGEEAFLDGASEASMVQLGKSLGTLCLPGNSAEAVAKLVDGCPVGSTVEVCFEAEADLLGLPFEALRLPDGRLLATQPSVVTFRRPSGLKAQVREPMAGPLKILVAVGAPDEGRSGGAVLDHERELQNILDAVEIARAHRNIEVRILEVGHPDSIAAAIEADAYHVLHLSCHGLPGALQLEDEDGGAVITTAAQLLEPIRRIGRPLPLVLLNSCLGGVQEGQAASFAEELIRAGVPCVLAMQTSVSDHYATKLAAAFYGHLARHENLLASRALALARKELESARLKAVQGGASSRETEPEYATASLFVGGEEHPLANFALDEQLLKIQPVYEMAGPVPQLRIDDLIGRRKELRETLRTLRDPSRRYAGVVLTGIGGVGKSAAAGRAMQRVKEDGCLVAACAGRFNLSGIALALGGALLQSNREHSQKMGGLLIRPNLPDEVRSSLVNQLMAEERVVLVLDDFEQNLTVGGDTFRDAEVGGYLHDLAGSCRRGRLLITCRHPIPGTEEFLHRIPIGPLSLAESRKLILRLPGLRGSDSTELAKILRVIGGHPRMLEFLDAILQGEGRLPHVTRKLAEVLERSGLDLASAAEGLEDSLHETLMLGARDVFLQELFDLARREGLDEALLQTGVSNLPVTPEGLARMLASDVSDAGDVPSATHALARLADLSLVHRSPDGSAWMHRWTAEGLASLADTSQQRARDNRAGRYRMWRVEHESHSLEDAVEGTRNFLAGRDFDAAVRGAGACFEALTRFQQLMGVATFASEVLETLPGSHPDWNAVADQEAQAHLALGLTDRALARYRKLLERHQRLAQAEPDRADYQRDLSVSYNKLGDLYRALGQGEQARQHYLKALAIAERLAQAEPDRADYQRDLSVSYSRVGDLYSDLGQGEQARQYYMKDLAIAERLAQAEPDRADYQRDLSVSYSRVGDLYHALGQGEQARQVFLKWLAIAERLAQAEPDRADYQRDLSVSYERVGDLYRDLGQGEQARQYYGKSLAISERLAQAEPDRADYQRDLSVSYNKAGDLLRAFGQREQARQAFLNSLGIRERLAQAEPDRADYQRDLSLSYAKLGELYRDLGQVEQARQCYLKSLTITQRLAQAEPDRADYQRDLSVSYNKMGDMYGDLGQGEQARQYYMKSLAIAERLAQAEPDRADYKRDLVVSLVKMGTIGEPDGNELLSRALSILETLKNRGELSPADERAISAVRQLLGGAATGR